MTLRQATGVTTWRFAQRMSLPIKPSGIAMRLSRRHGAGTRIRDQTSTILLAAFLGDFGIHRFYLGQPLAGLLYLAFFWTGIPGIVASLEAYRFAFMGPNDWADRYNDGRPGKPVPRWVLVVLIAMPLLIFAAFVVAIDAGYDF